MCCFWHIFSHTEEGCSGTVSITHWEICPQHYTPGKTSQRKWISKVILIIRALTWMVSLSQRSPIQRGLYLPAPKSNRALAWAQSTVTASVLLQQKTGLKGHGRRKGVRNSPQKVINRIGHEKRGKVSQQETWCQKEPSRNGLAGERCMSNISYPLSTHNKAEKRVSWSHGGLGSTE